ncbi:MAG: ABC transporter permease [Nitrospira sp.]
MIRTAAETDIHAGTSLRLILRNVYEYRSAINSMVRRELAVRYVGTIGGPLWVILQPLATVLVFWFVFSIGFKAQGPSKTSFILYFLSGYLPWLLFSEALSASIQSIVSNSHLVKKTIFPTEILPVVHFVGASFTHLVLLLCTTAAILAHGGNLYVTYVQIVYYYGALACLVLGLAWTLAALQVFHRDVGQVMGVVLNLWFWATPIVWTKEIMPQQYHWVINYNPIHYIVEGYRESLLYGLPIWHDIDATFSFWVMTIPVFLIGLQVFGRLKSEFADVL